MKGNKMNELEENTGSESQTSSQETMDTPSPEEVQNTKLEATATLIISQSPELGLNHDKLVACLKEGIDFGPRRLTPLKQVKNAGGDPNVTMDEWLEKTRDQIKKKISYLDDLAKRIIEIVEIFQRTPYRFEKNEREILNTLVAKISELTESTQD
jgi:hypothetical protein